MKFKRKEFLKDRKNAIERAVMFDDWEPAINYCKKYKIMMPTNESVFKAGIYKAAHECTDISDEVRAIADKKCLELGFKIGIS